MRTQIVFDGYYGMRNSGDDTFCVVAAEMARSRWGFSEIAFVAQASELPVLPMPAAGLFPERVRFRGHGRLAPVPAMLHSGRVVHVGGSTFQSMSNNRRTDEHWLARLGLLSLFAIGVSVGPFATPRAGRQVASFLRHFRRLHVRDSASAARLREIDPSLTPSVGFDVAVLLPDLDFCRGSVGNAPRADPTGRATLGVSVCHDATLRGALPQVEFQREQNIIQLLRQVARRRRVRMRFIVFNDHPRWGDGPITLRTAKELAHDVEVEVVPYTGDVRDTLEAVATCDALLGTRLHSAVFAYACRTPFALVAYQTKCIDFAAEVALPDRYLFPVQGPQSKVATAAMIELLADGESILNGMLPIETARERALSGFDTLDA